MGEIQKHKEGRYQSYQDSSVGWLGQVPSHWQLRKLKHIFSEKKIVHNSLLSCGAISFGEVVEKNGTLVPHSTRASYQEVLSGEFLINPLNLNYDLKSLRIALSQMDVAVSSGYIVIKNHLTINKTYYKWLLHRYDVAYMKLLGSGVRQTINFNHIADSLLVLPPKNEQTAIANFLDGKTAKIDQAIVQKERMIQLLQERKQILIQNAVTKGLDPNVKMKDSGVEWIGEVPEHWEVKNIKRLGNIINGYAFKSYEFKSSGIRVMKIANIQSMKIDWSDESFIDERYYKSHFRFCVAKGDLVFALTRPVISTGIKAAIIEEEEKILLNQRNAVLKPNRNLNKQWMYYVLFSDGFVQEFENQIDNTGLQPNIGTISIGNLKIGLPSIKEQQLIIDVLNKKTLAIDQAIASTYLQVKKLKEYKTTLIDHAVTGKIKVS